MAKIDELFFGENPIQSSGLTKDFGDFISTILPNIFVIASLILFLYLVAGGFMFISAGADTKQAETGKQALTNAIIGFVLIFASYWIIQIVEIVTGVPILK